MRCRPTAVIPAACNGRTVRFWLCITPEACRIINVTTWASSSGRRPQRGNLELDGANIFTMSRNQISHTVDNLPTPALVINAEIVRRNLNRLAEYARTHGLGIRPHTKTHKSRFIAKLQMEDRKSVV